MAKRTIVEINGRKYDANTGQIITNTPTATPVIDGFRAPVAATTQPVQKQATRVVNTASSSHQAPQKTKKLHSAALKKPYTPKTVNAKTQTVGRQANAPAVSARPIDSSAAARAERAKAHAKSEQVARFARTAEAAAPTVSQFDTVPETVAAAPVMQPMARPQVYKPKQEQASEQQPAQSESTEKKPGLLKRMRETKPRLVPVTIVSVVVLAFGGYVAYQSIPNMALRVASQRAGFSASLPGYSPSGFDFSGPVSYADGVVELEYSSNSGDGRSYKLIQKESSWDSQSLLDNYVLNASNDYLTFQERGITVYVYDTTNATWVDGGIWYTVEGNSLLTSEQLLKIASSL